MAFRVPKHNKPPLVPQQLGKAKHIYKKMGSLYDESKKKRQLTPGPSMEEIKRAEEVKYVSLVLSEHDRSQRSSSRASERAEVTRRSINLDISRNKEVMQTYNDTISSLNDVCA